MCSSAFGSMNFYKIVTSKRYRTHNHKYCNTCTQMRAKVCTYICLYTRTNLRARAHTHTHAYAHHDRREFYFFKVKIFVNNKFRIL